MLDRDASLSVWKLTPDNGTHYERCWLVHTVCSIERVRQLIYEACQERWQVGGFATEALIHWYKETTKDGEPRTLPFD